MGEIGISGKTLKSESFGIEVLWKGTRRFYFIYVSVIHIVTRHITYHLLDGAAVVGSAVKMYLCQVFGTDLIPLVSPWCLLCQQFTVQFGRGPSLFRTSMLYVF